MGWEIGETLILPDLRPGFKAGTGFITGEPTLADFLSPVHGPARQTINEHVRLETVGAIGLQT